METTATCTKKPFSTHAEVESDSLEPEVVQVREFRGQGPALRARRWTGATPSGIETGILAKR